MSEKRDVERVLESTRDEILHCIEYASTIEAKKAWYYTHLGEIEMAFFLGLISNDRSQELHEEWKTHLPTLELATQSHERADAHKSSHSIIYAREEKEKNAEESDTKAEVEMPRAFVWVSPRGSSAEVII